MEASPQQRSLFFHTLQEEETRHWCVCVGGGRGRQVGYTSALKLV